MRSPNQSAFRLNLIIEIIGAKTYLEIGTFKGVTFSDVICDTKYAVDPKFLFDTREYSTGDTHFYETTSDDFFSRAAGPSTFDVIFLDGMHTYDQTYRDFCNSLNRTHRDSVIVIDDTWPVDAFSASREQQECYRLRKAFSKSGPSPAWQGDVYKVLLLIKLFHPYLDFATLSEPGNPQTIVWRKPLLKNSTVEMRMEPPHQVCNIDRDLAIQNLASLDYLWFCRNISILQLSRDASLMNWLKNLRS